MPKLITRCLSADYQTVTDNHDDNDRGELDLSQLAEALHYGSYILPHSSNPNSPHRPAMGVFISGQTRPTFFYASDFQGAFSLQADSNGEFEADDIIDLVEGRVTIEEVRAKKAASGKRMGRGVKIVLGSMLFVLVYLFAVSFRGWA